MKKTVKIRCGTCKEYFLPKSQKNIYCKRSCFKKAFYHRKKAEELMDIKKFPFFKCPSCERNIKLDFDPIIEDKKWLSFSCPFCNVLMINVCEEIIAQDTSNI